MEQLLRALGRYRRAMTFLTWISLLGAMNFFLCIGGRTLYFFIGTFLPTAVFLYGKSIAPTGGQVFLTGGIFLALCLCALYAYLRFRAGRRGRSMITAAVLYGADTVALTFFSLLGYGLPGLVDALLHAYALSVLVRGACAGAWLDRAMQSDSLREQMTSLMIQNEMAYVNGLENAVFQGASDTLPLRPAEPKNAYLFHHRFEELEIRVSFSAELTELSVNGMVYAECRGMWEPAHALSAVVGGHRISVGLCHGTSCADMVLEIDGREIDRFRR